MINVWDYQNVDDEVRIDFTDGTYLIGKIDAIEDEEESELGEDGVAVFTPDGAYVGIGQSEIKNITVLERN
jgi:hypothetical protein